MRYAAGHLLEGYVNPEGGALQVAGSGDMFDHPVGSVVISRKRKQLKGKLQPLAQEQDEETYIPNRVLTGLLPECLLDQYSFWRTGPNLLRGYAKASSTQQLLVEAFEGVSPSAPAKKNELLP